MPPSNEPIPITSVDTPQLLQIRERIESEMQRFSSSGISLQKASNAFAASGRAIEQLSKAEEGQPIMIPLTSSLYVNASVGSNETVLIDIGTGYYVEMTVEEGMDYCKRKVTKLKESVDSINQLLREKNAQLQQVQMVIQDRYQKPPGQMQSRS